MRVLLWSQYFWPENFRINELATALQKSEIQVTVLTGKPNYPEGNLFPGYKAHDVNCEQFGSIKVVRIPIVPRGTGSPLGLALNYLSFIFSGLILAPFLLRWQKYDVVFVYAPSPLLQALPAILLARIKRAPLVVWVQDLWPESLTATGFVVNAWALKAIRVLVRYVYRYADSILIPSEAFREPVARFVRDAQKISYYPNTAEAVEGRADSCVNSKFIAELKKGFSVVFAGNIGVAQSIETVVEAAKLLQNESHIRLFIVGSGSRENWLRREIVRLGLNNIIAVGRLPYSEMPTVFSAASALLLTLKNAPNLSMTVPSKLQAYLAAGKPVIGSLNGEGARIIKEANAGFTCPAEDGRALATTILELCTLDHGKQKSLGDNGRRYFNTHYEPKQKVDELIEHFQDLVEKKEKGSS